MSTNNLPQDPYRAMLEQRIPLAPPQLTLVQPTPTQAPVDRSAATGKIPLSVRLRNPPSGNPTPVTQKS